MSIRPGPVEPDLGDVLNALALRVRNLETTVLGRTTPTGRWVIKDTGDAELVATDPDGATFDLVRPYLLAYVGLPNDTYPATTVALTGDGGTPQQVPGLTATVVVPGPVDDVTTKSRLIRVESFIRAVGDNGTGTGTLAAVRTVHLLDGAGSSQDSYAPVVTAGNWTAAHRVSWFAVPPGEHTIAVRLMWLATTVDVLVWTDGSGVPFLTVEDWGAIPT